MLERNKNIDLLRVIACVMVVVLHVSASYVTKNIKNPNIWFTIGNLIDSFMRVSVPIFVLISGAFNLSNNKNKEYNYFYKKTMKNIILPTIIWGFIYCSYYLLLSILQGNNITLKSLLGIYVNILLGRPFYHMWYMYMIIGLYMVSPIMIRSMEGVKLNRLFITSVLLLLLGMLSGICNELIWPFSFINYMGYYLLGYCLNKLCVLNNKPKTGIFIYIFGSLLTFIITEAIIRLGVLNKTLYFYEYLSPTVIISSIGIFIYFLKHKEFNVNVSKVLPHTFNIYIIHAGVYNVISILINKFDVWKNPIWFIPFLSLIVLLISLGVSYLINQTTTVIQVRLKYNKKRKFAALE